MLLASSFYEIDVVFVIITKIYSGFLLFFNLSISVIVVFISLPSHEKPNCYD